MSEISESKKPRIALLGVPIEIGASQRGTLMGPDALRTAGIGRVLEQLGFDVEDHGNLSVPAVSSADGAPPANAKYYEDIKAWIRALSERSFLLARSGAIPIFMGGDHSLSMGSVNGVVRYWQELGRPVFVLWLDAHADYNTPATTETGNMHGMSAAYLCGEPGLDGLLGGQPRASIAPDQLDLFGIRSIDPLERDLVRNRRIAVVDMRAIDEFGVGVLIRRIVDRVKARNGVLHVSFDVDFLDPAVAPGVLSRGASRDGAVARLRTGAVARHRRTQSISRRTRPHRARRGRTDRQPVRPADHRSSDTQQCGIPRRYLRADRQFR
jgi:arginase